MHFDEPFHFIAAAAYQITGKVRRCTTVVGEDFDLIADF